MTHERAARGLWVAMVMSLAACASAPARPDPVGHDLDFEAERLDEPGRLRLSELRGKLVLVDVWTSWCVPCREALPVWGALRQRIGDARFEVVGVSIDDDRAMAADFVAELGAAAPMGFPMVWDDGAVARRLAIEELPTLFLVDGDGVVRWVHAGFDEGTEALVEGAVQRLLEPAAAITDKTR